MFKIDKRYAKANNQKTIRFTDDLYSHLETIAKQENVSFNELVLQCCRYALDNMEKTDNSSL